MELSQELDGKSIHLAIRMQTQEYLLKWDLMLSFLPDSTMVIRKEELTKENWNLFGSQIHRVLEKMSIYLLMYFGIITVHLEDSTCT